MVLTPVAEGLVGPGAGHPAARFVARWGRSRGSTRRRATRHLSLAVSDYVTEILMADVLRAARCEAPHITFELRPVGRRAARTSRAASSTS